MTCHRHCAPDCRYSLPSGACALDIANEGEHTLVEVGALLGLTRERVRQIEQIALAKVAKLDRKLRLSLMEAARDMRHGEHVLATLPEQVEPGINWHEIRRGVDRMQRKVFAAIRKRGGEVPRVTHDMLFGRKAK